MILHSLLVLLSLVGPVHTASAAPEVLVESNVARTAQRQRRPAPAQTARETKAAETAAACSVLERWMAQLDREYPATNWASLPFLEAGRRALMLFGDESFVPYFNKPYDQMAREERRAATTGGAIYLCPVLSRKVYGEWVTARVRSGLAPGTLPSAAGHVGAIREARSKLAATLREIDALRESPDVYQRLDEIESAFKPQLAYLWERERNAFSASLAEARGRLAGTELPQRINAALAGQGYEALIQIRTLRDSLDRLAVGVDGATRDRYAAQLNARADALLRELLAAERATLASHGAGAAGLARDAEWHASFRERFAGPFAEVAEVKELQQQFESQRPARLAAAVPELTRLVAAASTHPAVDAVVTRHLVFDKDWQQREVLPVLVASWDRKDQLRRASGIAVAPAVPAGPRPAARAGQGSAAAAGSGTRRSTVLIRPTITALIHAQLRNAGREMLNARREKAAIAEAIADSRKAFWSCNPNCQNVDELLKPYGHALWEKDMYYLFMFLSQAAPSANIFAPQTPGMTPELIDKLTGGKIDGGIPEQCDSAFAQWGTAIRRASGGTTVQGAYFPDAGKLLAALRDQQEPYDSYSRCRDNYEYENRPLFTLTQSSDPYDYALLMFYEGLSYTETHAKRLKQSERLFETTAERFGEARVLTTAGLMMQAPKPQSATAVLEDPLVYGCTVRATNACFRQLLGERPDPAAEMGFNVTRRGGKVPPSSSPTPAATTSAGPDRASPSREPAASGAVRRRDTIDVEALEVLTGAYLHRTGTVTVKLNGEKGLTLTVPDGRVYELEYKGSFRFAIKGVPNAHVSFQPNGSQVVVSGLDARGIVGRRPMSGR